MSHLTPYPSPYDDLQVQRHHVFHQISWNPTTSFNILNHVSFCLSSTRSASHHKLVQQHVRSNKHRHLYFLRLPRLQNALPLLTYYFLLVPFRVNWKLTCGLSFLKISIQIYCAHIILSVHAVNVLQNLLTLNFHYQLLNIFLAFYRSCIRTYSTVHC